MDEANSVSDRTTLFPGETDYAAMYNMIFGRNIAQVVRCAVMFSLPEHLADGAATAGEIAQAESLDVDATFRLMRACVAFGLMTYDKDKGFSATRLLETLRKDDPHSLHSLAIVQGGRGHWAPSGQLDVAVRTGAAQAEATLGSTIWEYYATAAGAAEADAFSLSMGSASAALLREAGELIDTKSVGFAVDVGGAGGSLIHALMKRNEALRGAVLDLPRVEADATKAAEALGLGARLSFVGGDLFAEVPAADLYLLKLVLHDWPDQACVSILRNCRRAIRPDGRVILIEIVIDEIEPSPFVAQVDLTMMTVLGAKERTLAEYGMLLAAASFRITRVITTSTPFSIVEAVAI